MSPSARETPLYLCPDLIFTWQTSFIKISSSMVLKPGKVFTTAMFGWSQHPPSLWRWTSGCSWMSSSAVLLVLSTCLRTSQIWCSPYSGLKHKPPCPRAWQGLSTWSSCYRTSCRWGLSSFISLSNYWVCRAVVSAALSVVSSFSSPSFSMISDIREERGSKKNIQSEWLSLH